MPTSPDRACEAYASRHFGVIEHDAARRFGLSARQIRSRVEAGRWLILHPKVYLISGAPHSWEMQMMAACRWSSGVASHRAAGRVWRLPGFDLAPVELTTLKQRVLPRAGILVHHTRWLPDEQLAHRGTMPVTSIERTLMDIAAVCSRRKVAIAMDASLRRELTDLGALDRMLYLVARRGRRGCAVIRQLVHERIGDPKRPESPLETDLFQLLVRSGMELPAKQVTLFDASGGFLGTFDYVYPTERLIIEVQGYEWHSGRDAWQRDLDRFNRVTIAGYRVLQLTDSDIRRNPDRTLDRIATARRIGHELHVARRPVGGAG